MSRQTADTEARLQRAAISFASDYGPLPAALRGEEKARAKVADRLVEALLREGFSLIPPKKEATTGEVPPCA